MTQCLLQGKKFFCREWTFSKLNHCLENRPTSKTGGALIMGGPGCGKTAVCCEVVWPSTHGKQKSLTKRVLAYHFCQAHDIETLSITRFIHSLVKQLKKSHLIEGYREKLQDPAIRRCLDVRECEKNPDDAFKQAIINPLLTIKAPSQNLMLLVDSIDESYFQYINDRLQSSRTIAELLANHHNMLPRWLLLVCSSRKQSKSVTRLFTGFRKISLDDLRKSHVVRDVQQYILCRLDQEEDLRQHLSRETAEMLNQLHIKSNGCFLYLEKVLDGVADSFIILREIRDIPGTLNGLYLWLCQRLFLRKQFAKIQPILNAILAARKPLSESELYLSLQTRNNTLSREEFNRRLKLLSKILIDGKGGSKILFHHSFAEWLLDVKHCTQKYLCNASEGHGILAMYATLNAPNLTPEEVQDFALHLERTSTQVPVNHNCLVQWLLLSGANVEDSLLPGIPKDSKVLKLLVDAGAKMPTEEEDIQSISASMSALNDIPDSDNEKSFIELEVPLGQLDSSGRTLLHTAAYHGNLQMVSYLISKEANIEAADKSGQTPLNLAARQGHPDVVAELLHAGSDVNHADNDGWTALRSASWGGHTDVVSLLLDEKVEVDHTDSDQRTALRAAAWGGHEEIVIQLLKQGADSNKVDNEGRTALIAAAYMGHVEIVEHLLDFNASIDHEDRDGRTALSVAALCIPASVGHEKVVSLLLERGAEVDHQDHDGMTPLLVAAYEGHKDVCELLLEWDADIDHSDHNNRSPLLAAASMGHADVVGQLLFWNAAVDTIDAEGRTVLSIAAAQGNVAVVQQLLDRGLDEMHKDNAGWMPLHMAAFEGHSQVCEILMEQGAKVNELDNDGRSPLILAAQEGHLSVTQTLVEHCAHLDHKAHDGRTPFRSSCLENHKELADYLLSEGANINYKDPDGRSTLYVVVLENKLEMAKFLLEKGAVVDGTDLEGRTGLHVASWQGLFEMAEQLIIYGADVNAEDNDKRTALQSAAWQGHANVVRLLLEKGAKVDHTCNQGATALCIAAQEGHDQVVKVLLQFHANPNHADQFGRTPIRVAYKSGHSAVCKLLEHYGANPVNGAKSRSGSSTSSNDTKSSGYIAGSTAVNIVDRNPLHSSPSDSPDSTSDRRKSYVSNNSSTGRSSSLTTSTNQSSHGLQIKFDPDNCLTFTQQLQQCSMSRNRSRPVSRVLSPVSEPQSPVQSPITSPVIESHGITGFIKPSPHNDNILTPSPVKYSSIKQEKISATINIITNPNAELPYSNDEPIWQINPAYFKNNLARLELQRKNNTDMSNKTVMGQRAATEPRSPPEMRRKRNGIVTNPKVINKSPGMNGHYNKLTTNGGGDSAMINTNGITTNNITLTNNITNGHKTPVRPNGLPLKKETPL